MSLRRVFLGDANGWTGAQYSVVRFVFGVYLAVHFAHLVPWGAEVFSSAGVLPSSASPLFALLPSIFWVSDSPAMVTGVLMTSTVVAILFALGVRDRWMALLLWWLWASLFDRNPLISNPGLPYVGWMLLAHTFLAPRPLWSVDGRKAADAGASWSFPQPLHLAAWIVLAAGYSYSGYTKLVSPSWLDGSAFTYVLESPLARSGGAGELLLMLPEVFRQAATWGALGMELLFLPLASFARLRPLLWVSLLAMHFGLITLIDFADLSLGMVMIHLFTFDPAWIPAVRRSGAETLFFDGDCGLCHRFVRFVLSEDPGGQAFRFAPLRGETFQTQTTEADRAALPDSVVVKTVDGVLLTRSEAALHVMKRLGGIWRLLATVASLVPRGTLDATYDRIAATRKKLFAKPPEGCPVASREARLRFEP